MGGEQAPQQAEEHRKGGLLDRLFGGHHDEEAAPVAQTEQPEMPADAMDTSKAVAAAATTGEATQSVEGVDVKSAGTDMVVGGGEAVINLKDAEVHPAEVGEEKPEGDLATSTTEDESDTATDMQSSESETAIPVVTDSPGEFSTAVPPAEVKDELPVVAPSEGAESAGPEPVNSESGATDSAPEEADSSGDPALEKLEQWQEELATGADDTQNKPKTSSPVAASESEVAMPMPETAPKESEERNTDSKDDFAANLVAEAVDEAAAIDAAVAESKPEIHAMGGEIPAEARDEVDTSEVAKPQNDVAATEREPVAAPAEDEPFPAPPVEDEADKPEVNTDESTDNETGANTANPEANADMNESDSSVMVDGGDVHLDRAKYLEQEEPAADNEPVKQEQGEAAGAEVIDFTKHIEALNAAEEAVRNAKQDLIDRQKAA